jgi:hypothetical protein
MNGRKKKKVNYSEEADRTEMAYMMHDDSKDAEETG